MLGAIILSAIIAVLTVFAVLAWWRIGDNWADNEHKRFKDKPPSPQGPRVIHTAPKADTPDNLSPTTGGDH